MNLVVLNLSWNFLSGETVFHHLKSCRGLIAVVRLGDGSQGVRENAPLLLCVHTAVEGCDFALVGRAVQMHR